MFNVMNLKKNLYKIALLIGLFNLPMSEIFALTYSISDNDNVVGEIYTIRAKSGDTLIDLAEEYDIGVMAMIQANPHLNNKELKNGTSVKIPAQFVLPHTAPREGIVLNTADMRVFYYHPDDNKVNTYPVGIGRQGWATPVGLTRVITKEKDPTWDPPASIRREAASQGKTLPAFIPPGPNNPLGKYALHLGFRGILMHGTNKPSSVGLRSSHGCIRMYAEDIKELFHNVIIGTPVRILYEPHHNE